MDQKGIFELFFVIIMMVLIYPVTTHNKSIHVPNLIAQTDNLSLLVDYAITDALFDKVYESHSLLEQDTNVTSYINNVLLVFNKTQGVTCSLGVLNKTLLLDIYEGTIDITCEALDSKIVKTLTFKKKITINHNPNIVTCQQNWNIIVVDQLDSSINLSRTTSTIPLPNCTPQIIP